MKARKLKKTFPSYPRFNKINGLHPLQDIEANCFVGYEARKRPGGRVAAFNFDLAKEMGLIPKNHENLINEELEKSILDTFSIMIINEYDKINNIKFKSEDILPHKYMATRYLQLQHPSKNGTTSGDGRSIWNGTISHAGMTYDISSCGTGATCLSPATSINNKFYQTGDPSVSYGCGYSEIDEGFSSLFFSEVLKKNNITSESVLGVIEFKNGLSINIRVHGNLLRPSHMFNHLRQNNLTDLKALVDYYIDREISNGKWESIPKSPKEKYTLFLNKQMEVFSKMAADFEDHYLFCWLDWDGDNILMDGGIIDYGSVRQFGLFHHEYRYDDVDRFSTTITEQKNKARYIVQSFAQMIDYIITGQKKPIKDFLQSDTILDFDAHFESCKNYNFLYRLGLKKDVSLNIIAKNEKFIKQFRAIFSYFERSKSIVGLENVEDGINWSAIFCMRDILRELPQIYLSRGENLKDEEFIDIIKSNYATPEDLELTAYRKKNISTFQKYYWELLDLVSAERKKEVEDCLLDISMRSSVINKYDRVTGDSITTIVDKLLSVQKKIGPDKIFEILKEFVVYQNLDPITEKKEKHIKEKQSKLMKSLVRIVCDYREGL